MHFVGFKNPTHFFTHALKFLKQDFHHNLYFLCVAADTAGIVRRNMGASVPSATVPANSSPQLYKLRNRPDLAQLPVPMYGRSLILWVLWIISLTPQICLRTLIFAYIQTMLLSCLVTYDPDELEVESCNFVNDFWNPQSSKTGDKLMVGNQSI